MRQLLYYSSDYRQEIYRPIGRVLAVAFVVALAVSLAACKNYQVSVNEREVYRPKALLTDINIPDHALANCIHQHIKDQRITELSELQALVCTHAGIVSVRGLNQFSALTALDLSDNQIRDLSGLEGLSKLTRLNLRNNRVAGGQTLFTLLNVEWLDLSGSPEIECRDIDQLRRFERLTVIAPKHCQ